MTEYGGKNGTMMQSDAQHMLKVLMETVVSSGQAGQHILLGGQSSLVRNTLFGAAAEVEGVMLLRPSVSTLESAGDIAAVLTHLKSGHFLFIEHLHRLSTATSAVLPQAMERFILHIQVGQGSTMKAVDLALPQFILIGATARPHLLPESLKKCFGQQIWIDDFPDSPSSPEAVLH